MFRELTRKKQKLGMDECLCLLSKEKRGVLSVCGDEGYPYGMPMNHFYNTEDGCIYFHCGKTGHRLDSIKRNSKASFCVYDKGYVKENEWALNIKSVIVFGRIEIIDSIERITEITEKLCQKFTDNESYVKNEIEKFAKVTLLLRLSPEHICGKLVNES